MWICHCELLVQCYDIEITIEVSHFYGDLITHVVYHYEVDKYWC